jgi:hypothetical protein
MDPSYVPHLLPVFHFCKHMGSTPSSSVVDRSRLDHFGCVDLFNLPADDVGVPRTAIVDSLPWIRPNGVRLVGPVHGLVTTAVSTAVRVAPMLTKQRLVR